MWATGYARAARKDPYSTRQIVDVQGNHVFGNAAQRPADTCRFTAERHGLTNKLRDIDPIQHHGRIDGWWSIRSNAAREPHVPRIINRQSYWHVLGGGYVKRNQQHILCRFVGRVEIARRCWIADRVPGSRGHVSRIQQGLGKADPRRESDLRGASWPPSQRRPAWPRGQRNAAAL